MLKSELRSAYNEKRAQLSSAHIQDKSISIANSLLQMPIWHFAYYHIFLSIEKNNEVDTSPILTLLNGKDKHIVLPKVTGKYGLRNFLLTDSTLLVPNSLNIPEPVDGIEINEPKIDVVFVPLLAFDHEGNRVGYGKGYYDNFLRKCKPKVVKIGLSFFEAAEQIKDIHQNDVKLDYCVTPYRIYKF